MPSELEKLSTGFKHGGCRPGAGRPAGSVNKTTAEIRELAGAWGPQAIEKAASLAGLVLDEAGRPVGEAESEAVRLAAIQLLLDRAYGKSPMAISGIVGGPVEVRQEPSKLDLARWVAYTLSQGDRMAQYGSGSGAIVE